MGFDLKKLIPKDTGDKIGVGATLLLLCLITTNDLIQLNIQYHNNFPSAFTKLAIGLFILFNVLGNMYKAIRVDSTIYSLELPVLLLPEWRYCSACEQNAPPRAYHCFTCKKCVLKRHNHCMFLGKCVGNNNHRYYMMFVVYVWLGTLISNLINEEYFSEALANAGLKQVFIFFMPILAVAFGLISFVEFFIVFTNSVTLILFFLVFFYMLVNLKMVLQGQTWHESSKNISVYNLSAYENWQQVFGSNWLSAMLNPFSKLKLASNGSKFRTNNSLVEERQRQELYSMNDIYKVNNSFLLKKRDNVKFM